MKKDEIRKIFLSKRLFLSKDEVSQKSKKISDQFFINISLEKIKVIHTFLTMAHKAEANTQMIIHRLRQEYPLLPIVVPVTNFVNNSLDSYFLNEDTFFEKNSWGTPEPLNAKKADPHLIDLVITPLLAFDLNGNRVGYGKGFYDDFFSKNCRGDVYKVGLSLFEPVSKIDDIRCGDIKLDACITPEKFYRFG